MYTSQELVEARLDRNLTPEEVLLFEPLAEAVKQFIDSYTGRTFESTASESRFFDGNGSNEVAIDDLLSAEEVFATDLNGEDDWEVGAESYVLYPQNSSPKTSVVLIRRRVPVGNRNMRIKGIWGYSETAPKDIEFIATQMITEIFSNPQGLKKESIEGYSREFAQVLDDKTKNMLDLRTRVLIGG